MAESIFWKDFGVLCPDTLAEVDTIGFLNLPIKYLQNLSDATLIANVLSSAIKFLATPRGLSNIMVVGFVERSIMSYARSDTFSTCFSSMASLATKHIIALLSSRCFNLYTFSTAFSFVASQPMPQTVSVG